MKEINILCVDDELDNRENLFKILNDEQIQGHTLKIKCLENFEEAFNEILINNYHIVILDIFQGKPDDNGNKLGLNVLSKIQDNLFIPVIFFSGNAGAVENLKSEIIGVVRKSDGFEILKNEIERLIISNLPFIKENITFHLEKEFKNYFWGIIHEKRDIFIQGRSDFSLGYLMLRKLGSSLSKEKISEIIGNTNIPTHKVHPMEFYIYPTDNTKEYEVGELLSKGNDIFVILTPSCDLALRNGTKRKVDTVLLAKTLLFSHSADYIQYEKLKTKADKTEDEIKKQSNYRGKLVNWTRNNQGEKDKFFFLPETPFIKNRIIDFQDKMMVNYKDLSDYTRLAKLDAPFAESMVSSFIRFYNRIGFPDLDSEHIIEKI